MECSDVRYAVLDEVNGDRCGIFRVVALRTGRERVFVKPWTIRKLSQAEEQLREMSSQCPTMECWIEEIMPGPIVPVQMRVGGGEYQPEPKIEQVFAAAKKRCVLLGGAARMGMYRVTAKGGDLSTGWENTSLASAQAVETVLRSLHPDAAIEERVIPEGIIRLVGDFDELLRKAREDNGGR